MPAGILPSRRLVGGILRQRAHDAARPRVGRRNDLLAGLEYVSYVARTATSQDQRCDEFACVVGVSPGCGAACEGTGSVYNANGALASALPHAEVVE